MKNNRIVLGKQSRREEYNPPILGTKERCMNPPPRAKNGAPQEEGQCRRSLSIKPSQKCLPRAKTKIKQGGPSAKRDTVSPFRGAQVHMPSIKIVGGGVGGGGGGGGDPRRVSTPGPNREQMFVMRDKSQMKNKLICNNFYINIPEDRKTPIIVPIKGSQYVLQKQSGSLLGGPVGAVNHKLSKGGGLGGAGGICIGNNGLPVPGLPNTEKRVIDIDSEEQIERNYKEECFNKVSVFKRQVVGGSRNIVPGSALSEYFGKQGSPSTGIIISPTETARSSNNPNIQHNYQQINSHGSPIDTFRYAAPGPIAPIDPSLLFDPREDNNNNVFNGTGDICIIDEISANIEELLGGLESADHILEGDKEEERWGNPLLEKAQMVDISALGIGGEDERREGERKLFRIKKGVGRVVAQTPLPIGRNNPTQNNNNNNNKLMKHKISLRVIKNKPLSEVPSQYNPPHPHPPTKLFPKH